MDEDLAQLAKEIEMKAMSKGLVVYPVVPLPSNGHDMRVQWPGDWNTFLDLAIQVQSPMIYLYTTTFELEVEIADRLKGLGWDEEDEEEDEACTWFREQANEQTTKWMKYQDMVSWVYAVWIKEGVTHTKSATAEWLTDFQDLLEKLEDQARNIQKENEQENRQAYKEESAKRLLEYARQMVEHERFKDAKSEAKREFMAQQLFPDGDLPARRIASVAMLYHWWYIAPEARISEEEKITDLYEGGETIKNIAAMLNISEAAVKRVIKSEPARD